MPGQAQTVWKSHYEKWLQYLEEMVKAAGAGKSIPLGPSAVPLEPPAPLESVSVPAHVIFCAPHPDDEALSGALALRLRLDCGAQVTNVAITLGSDKSQRARRLRELESACHALGFRLVVPQFPAGLDEVDPACLENSPGEWAAKVKILEEIFDRESPDVVLVPHAQDFNTTHVATHFLVVQALGAHLERSGRGPVLVIETEFWHQIEKPNFMLGLTPELVAAQLVGIAEHGDEMRRNPYHLLHACRLMDNIRRGSEVVGGQGAAAQLFEFAELYNVTFMRGKDVLPARPGGIIAGPCSKINAVWLKSQFGTPETE